MGAGCYYRNSLDKKAFWIDLDTDVFEGMSDEETQDKYDIACGYTLSLIEEVLSKTKYKKVTPLRYESEMYILELEGTYYGDGIVFYLEPKEEYEKLGTAMFDKNYKGLGKKLLKHFNESLRIATSGYTSCLYKETL